MKIARITKTIVFMTRNLDPCPFVASRFDKGLTVRHDVILPGAQLSLTPRFYEVLRRHRSGGTAECLYQSGEPSQFSTPSPAYRFQSALCPSEYARFEGSASPTRSNVGRSVATDRKQSPEPYPASVICSQIAAAVDSGDAKMNLIGRNAVTCASPRRFSASSVAVWPISPSSKLACRTSCGVLENARFGVT
jgi:hypothetical protein